jgi:hypothetical protein
LRCNALNANEEIIQRTRTAKTLPENWKKISIVLSAEKKFFTKKQRQNKIIGFFREA